PADRGLRDRDGLAALPQPLADAPGQREQLLVHPPASWRPFCRAPVSRPGDAIRNWRPSSICRSTVLRFAGGGPSGIDRLGAKGPKAILPSWISPMTLFRRCIVVPPSFAPGGTGMAAP